MVGTYGAGYDALNRVTGEIRGGTNASTHAYGYDLAGNRTSSDGQALTFDAANKYLGVPGGAAAYDLDGNLTSISGTGLPVATFAWDDDNELTTLTSGGSGTSYGYDGSGMRVWSQTGSGPRKFYIFDGDTLLGEVNAAGSLSAAYTWGSNGLVSERVGAANKSLWYHFGPQGETRQLTDSTGAIADTYAYTAYGVPTASTGTDANPFRYGGLAGYYTDSNAAGAVLCTYRWYSPDMGRWLTRDPISYEGGHNLYGYCDGDPVNWIDPDGLEEEPIPTEWCASERRKITNIIIKLKNEVDSYNPLTDWEGGFETSWKNKDRTVHKTHPHGHYDHIKRLQKGLQDRIDRFNNHCGKRSPSTKITMPAPEYLREPVKSEEGPPADEVRFGRSSAIDWGNVARVGAGIVGVGSLIWLCPEIAIPVIGKLVTN